MASTGNKRAATQEDHPGGQSGTDDPRADWREEVYNAARELLDDELLRRLQDHSGEVGKIGDAILAAHLDDLRLLEQSRYHRARRDIGREMAVGSKLDAARARERLEATSAELGLLRLQRDLATGSVDLAGGEHVTGRQQHSAD